MFNVDNKVNHVILSLRMNTNFINTFTQVL